jgi:hypothetical protein
VGEKWGKLVKMGRNGEKSTKVITEKTRKKKK